MLSAFSYSFNEVALLLLAFLLLFWTGHRIIQVRDLPPGPRRLPIFGNAFHVPRRTPWLKFSEWSKVYGTLKFLIIGFKEVDAALRDLGDIVFLRVFGCSLLVLNSVEAVTDLFETRSAIYSDRPRRVMAEL